MLRGGARGRGRPSGGIATAGPGVVRGHRAGRRGEAGARLGMRVQLAVCTAAEAGPKQFNPSAKCALAPTAYMVWKAGMSV